MKRIKPIVLALLLAAPWVMAQTLPPPPTPAPVPVAPAPAPATATAPASKLTSEFSALAGSPENSAALVQGLRSATPITLSSAPGTSGPASSTTFTPTTKPMGYGNVRIALSLARTQLASQGISNPTPQQLQGALVGAPGSSTQGVLQMRAAGMGWGQIANAMGVKLGAVMSGKQALTPTTAATTTTATGATTAAGRASSAHGTSAKTAVSAAGQPAGGAPGKSGVTSAAGQGAGSSVTSASGNAYGHGGGVVNAGGGKAGTLAGNNAGGQGKGGGKP